MGVPGRGAAGAENPAAIDGLEVNRLLAGDAQLAVAGLGNVGNPHFHRHTAVPVGCLAGFLTIGEHIVVFPLVDQEQLAAHFEQAVGIGGFRNHCVTVQVFDRAHVDVKDLSCGVFLAVDFTDDIRVFEQAVVAQWVGLGAAVGHGDGGD